MKSRLRRSRIWVDDASAEGIVCAHMETRSSRWARVRKAAGVFVLLCARVTPADGAPAGPNVVVVLADQWRAQAFGFAGDPNVRTPRLDRFAAESVRFVNAVAGLPVCSPTRASLLTGQRPLTHGIFLNDVPLPSDAVTLAEVLRGAGWETAAIGKWHVDGHGRQSFIPRERRQGFDYWKMLECAHDYTNSPYFADTPERLHWEGYDAHAQTRDACAYVRSRAATAGPFLLWLAWGPPHNPYHTAPERYRAHYDPAGMVLRPNVPPEFADATRRDLAGYYAHCTALDDAFGELMDALTSSGLATNTVVVFTADHGDMLGSQGMARKQKPYDESVCVPMLIRWPAGLGRGGTTVEAPFNSEDLAPTVLGLVGLKHPPTMEGLDFSDCLRGGPAPGDGAALIACITPFGEFERRVGGREYRGIRTDRFTYVRDLDGPWLFFDRVTDPFQQTNLVGIARYSGMQAELDARLKAKLHAQRDAFLPGPDYIRQRGYRVNAHGTAPTGP